MEDFNFEALIVFLGVASGIVHGLIAKFTKITEKVRNIIILVSGPLLALVYQYVIVAAFPEIGLPSMGTWYRLLLLGLYWSLMELGLVQSYTGIIKKKTNE